MIVDCIKIEDNMWQYQPYWAKNVTSPIRFAIVAPSVTTGKWYCEMMDSRLHCEYCASDLSLAYARRIAHMYAQCGQYPNDHRARIRWTRLTGR